jgi:hypothetical protein
LIDLEKLEKEIDNQIDKEKQETGFNSLSTLAQKEFLRLIKEQNNRLGKS